MQHLLHRIFPCWCLFTGQHTQFHYAYHHQGCGMANRALLPSKKTRWVSDQQSLDKSSFPFKLSSSLRKCHKIPWMPGEIQVVWSTFWPQEEILEYDLLVGSDGVRSRVREAMNSQLPPGKAWQGQLERRLMTLYGLKGTKLQEIMVFTTHKNLFWKKHVIVDVQLLNTAVGVPCWFDVWNPPARTSAFQC